MMTVQPSLSRRLCLPLSLAFAALLNLAGNPAWAGDPFRTTNPRNIGDKTEAAFEAIFREGNYPEAKQYLDQALVSEARDPLVYAMTASLAFTEGNYEEMKSAASKTLETANKLKPQDPLRGNLYLAVGHFLEGVYIFKQQGPVGAVPKLQQVFQYFDAAEKVAPQDPELNLLKGYLDLFLAVNLPFSSPEEAIQRFEKYGAPPYMVERGIAIAYRDLYKQNEKSKNYDKAMQYLNKAMQYLERAMKASPDNPELYYLKGQFLRSQGRSTKNVAALKQAVPYFEKALQKEAQLPRQVRISLNHEYNAVQGEIKELEGTGAAATK